MGKLFNEDRFISADSVNALSIGIASPEEIRKWSCGEVLLSDTISYRTQKPVPDGLFCQKIFGPIKDYECACGKHKVKREAGKICSSCGVIVGPSSLRRERMGHIELAAPCAHIWFAHGAASFISRLLDMKQKDLELVLNYTAYIVIDAGDTEMFKGQILSEEEFGNMFDKYDMSFKAEKGAGAIKTLLAELDLDQLAKDLANKYTTTKSKSVRAKIITRLSLVNNLRKSKNKPEWVIMDVIPVMPPDLRPMAQLDGGLYASSDINELYRKVINCNNRLRKMIENNAPEIILDNEKRMLQQAVDCLFDNAKVQGYKATSGKRELKSISEALGGKNGRFRQNLLGKRVDYSGRSVICVEPKLKIWQCGLPKPLALELFNPFVCKRLTDLYPNVTARAARRMVERQDMKVWGALEDVMEGHPVFLNRAPTLHRLGIQAFQPVLVEGNAIKLNPLVCAAFNADFDGDQMAVHLPLSAEAQAEARFLMLSANNLLKPSDGKPVAVPSQDMVLGAYYLTMDKDGEIGEGKVFRDMNEVEMAFNEKQITYHSKIKCRVSNEYGSKLIDTTYGKLIFNSIIPQDLGYVDRDKDKFGLEINFLVKKKQLGAIAEKCIHKHGMTVAAEVLDNMKALGYKYSTLAGITVGVFDAKIPEEKAEIIETTNARVDKLNTMYKRGFLNESERYKHCVMAWNEATDKLTKLLEAQYDPINNPIHMMADSGARGSTAQIRQLAGMRGLIANTSGATIEMPIRSNYREGLSILEYFIASRGARKGLADTALRTADSGYMTRRLVDVAQSAVIREYDCGTEDGIWVYSIMGTSSNEVIEGIEDRVFGRFLAEDVDVDDIHITKNQLITRELASKIANSDIKRIKVRSAVTCKCENGICAKCYGLNLSTNKTALIGDAVGVMSAQSIGEPGTQLTMRTFHTGGVASESGDITRGLPRVEEVFEDRTPKVSAILAEIDGFVRISEKKKRTVITLYEDFNDVSSEHKSYILNYTIKPVVKEGIFVHKGDRLTTGVIKPGDLLLTRGEEATREYIVTEIQKVYRLQGVDINDKHIEVILRYLMNKVLIIDAGSSEFVENTEQSKSKVLKANAELQKRIDAGEDVKLIEYQPVLHGLTKAGTSCESFLSAASFQETSRVLTAAAIEGKVDTLEGLKENVIVGRVIPAGTGMNCYSDVEIALND